MDSTKLSGGALGKRAFGSGLLFLLIALMSAGWGQNNTVLPPLEVAVGTANGGSAPALMVFALMRTESRIPASTLVRIGGPQNWNNQQPLEIAVEAGYRGSVSTFNWNSQMVAVAGEYTFSVPSLGRAFTGRATLNPTQLLPLTSGINVTSSVNQVQVGWNPVPGAELYWVGVQDEAGGFWVATSYTLQLGRIFSNLALSEARNYRVRVDAYNQDHIFTLPPQISGPFNVSYRFSTSFKPGGSANAAP